MNEYFIASDITSMIAMVATAELLHPSSASSMGMTSAATSAAAAHTITHAGENTSVTHTGCPARCGFTSTHSPTTVRSSVYHPCVMG